MKNRLFVFALIGLIVLVGVFAVGAQETTPETLPPAPMFRSDVSLAIYNQGTALVQDRRSFAFVEGENRIDFTDVAAGIDATSVTFISLTDPLGTIVLEQNFVFDLVNAQALANRYIDEQVQIVLEDGTVYQGVLLSTNGGFILRQDDGQVITLSAFVREVRFPQLPDGLITRPTLRWTIQSAAGGEQDVQLTYLTSGMTWTADYNVLLASGDASLDLNGWVTLTNTSGTTYRDAQVKLIAGDVNRIYAQPEMQYMADAVMAAPTAARSAGVEQRDISEYKLYEIERLVTVANNETKQVEFVTGADVPATTYYVYEASYPYYGGGPVYDQYYGSSGISDVATYLEFSTDEDGGLGADLPAGRVRVYQADVDGGAVLIGENFIDHTPEGETVDLYLGNAFDLVAERIQTNYTYLGLDVLEETFEIRLRNRKDDETVEIRVPEHLSRWSNWEILTASQAYTQIDASTIEFRAQVEPGAETVITYTVRYTFPR